MNGLRFLFEREQITPELLKAVLSAIFTYSILLTTRADAVAHISAPPLPSDFLCVVWIAMLVLMGIAVYFVVISSSEARHEAIRTYLLQLSLYVTWPLVFYILEAYLLAFVWLMVLCYLVLLTTICFYQAEKKSGYMMMGYLLWLCIMAVLNFASITAQLKLPG